MADHNRSEFELWYVGHAFDKTPPEIERDGQGNYILAQTRSAWNAWHAGWITGRNDLTQELAEVDDAGVPAGDPAQPFTEPGKRRWSRVIEVMIEAMERVIRNFDAGTAEDYTKACIAFDDALSAELDRVTAHGVETSETQGAKR